MERKYHLFDAKGKVLGRLATEVARVLDGKGKVDYAPQADGGDFAVIINVDKLQVSGEKTQKKVYHRFSGYPGGLKATQMKDRMDKDSRAVFYSAVYGMLPKNKLRNQMLKRLLIHRDDQHQYAIDVTH